MAGVLPQLVQTILPSDFVGQLLDAAALELAYSFAFHGFYGWLLEPDHTLDSVHLYIDGSDSRHSDYSHSEGPSISGFYTLLCVSTTVSFPHNEGSQGTDCLHVGIWQHAEGAGAVAADGEVLAGDLIPATLYLMVHWIQKVQLSIRSSVAAH